MRCALRAPGAVIARLRLSGPVRAYCEADRWSFDPRYTQGRCPVCGWRPEGAAPAPTWLAIANRVDWEVLGLLLFADVLVLVGLAVASAAGLLPHSFTGGGGVTPAHTVVASAPRLH
ncbi:MAG TPA: hypothetical protein VFL27_09220 [Candidatus Dormibacteraeota bacterium]|nr:hypothetical protein [Candidatus Dormibacteraeota bacterium]